MDNLKRLLSGYGDVSLAIFVLRSSSDLRESDDNARYRQLRVKQFSLENQIVAYMLESNSHKV